MDHDQSPRTVPSRFRTAARRAALLFLGGTVFGILTILLPPWVEVKSRRQVGLYLSHWVKDEDPHFVGYDFLFANEKWSSVGPPAPTYSGAVYSMTEYRIYWPLILVQGAVVLLLWTSACVVLVWGARVTPAAPRK
jgi:hypothetical protein